MDANKTAREITPEQRKNLIAAILNGTIETAQAIHQGIAGEKVIIHNFLAHLKFTNTIGRKFEDFEKVQIAPGRYRDALERMSNSIDNSGNLISPFIPIDALTEDELKQTTDNEHCKQQ